jgi:hypothetical protein
VFKLHAPLHWIFGFVEDAISVVLYDIVRYWNQMNLGSV